MKMRALVATIPAALLVLAGCADSETDASPERSSEPEGELTVLSAFYPYHFLAERIGGEDVEAEILTEPGVEPHDLELSPRQVADLGESDLVIYQGGFQPAVDEAVDQQSPEHVLEVNGVLDREPVADEHDHAGEHEDSDPEASADPSASPSPAASAHGVEEHADEHGGEHGGEEDGGEEEGHGHSHGTDLASDPHVWLDPETMAVLAEAVADALAEADPDRAEEYRDRAAELADELETLDEEYRTGLADCDRDSVVVNHAAFGHLTERYGLEQVPVNGLTPDAAPTPERLAELAALIESEGATTVFTETLANPRLAETLADEAGVETATLDPLEGLAEDDDRDYLSVMRDNLEALRTGLGCS